MEEGSGEKGTGASFHEEELTLRVGWVGCSNVFDVEYPVFEGVKVEVGGVGGGAVVA